MDANEFPPEAIDDVLHLGALIEQLRSKLDDDEIKVDPTESETFERLAAPLRERLTRRLTAVHLGSVADQETVSLTLDYLLLLRQRVHLVLDHLQLQGVEAHEKTLQDWREADARFGKVIKFVSHFLKTEEESALENELEVVFSGDLTEKQRLVFLEVLGDLFEASGGKGGLKVVGREEVRESVEELVS